MTASDWPSFTSLEYVRCYAQAFPQRRLELITMDGRRSTYAAFYVYDGVAENILPTVPWESGSTAGLTKTRLESMRSSLGVEVLWFPLICLDIPGTCELKALQGVVVSSRRPSPIINMDIDSAGTWARACGNLGRRAERRRQAFERLGLMCREVGDSRLAVEFLAHIERLSWKATCGQDMFSRDQFNLYSALLKNRVLRAIVVFDGDRPVAYRLDGRADDTLYCVKWSYDEHYARSSPGFYLIAVDLPRRYQEHGLTRIDLFGGLDSLKQVVMTGERARVDIAWPDGERARGLILQGVQHDALVENHLKTGRGLRHLYRTG